MNISKKIKPLGASYWILLIFLMIIIILITYFRVNLQIEYGPIFDTLDLLSNAAFFAGKGIGYTDLTRPPLLSLLTSIYFYFDGLSIWPIFVIDAALYILGCVGLFLFLKERFDAVYSLIGSLLFATFPLIITFLGVGYNDVSGVSLAIWSIYLTYLAINKNSKFFFLSFPVAILAFLTRYNMALIIFPIFLYILINRDKIKDRNIFIGIILSMLVLVPLLIFFNAKFGDPLFPFLTFFKTSGGSTYTEHFAYNSDLLFFLKNMHLYIGPQSALILVVTLAGFLVYLFRKWKKDKTTDNFWSIKLQSLKIDLKVLTLFILILLFILSFGNTHYMISEVIFFFIAYCIYMIFQDKGIDVKTDLLFFSWFMAFFIFQSIYVIKDHRYFITMYPALTYFLIRGIYWALSELKANFKGKNLTRYFLAFVLMVIMLLSLFTHFSNIEKDNQKNKLMNEDALEASNWLINYDFEYKSKVIYADMWPFFSWYLQMDVKKMPIFKNNQKLYAGGIKDKNFTQEDLTAINNELNRIAPDYYISILPNMNFTSYVPIKKFRLITIFKRVK